jgi:rubrerythrin
MFETKEILDLAVRLEKNGEAVYRRAMSTETRGELRSMLEWMAEEEAGHGRWFADLKAALDKGIRNPFMEEMSRGVFEDLLGGQAFSLKEVDFSKVADTDELMSIFIEFETDTVLFYEMIMPFIEDDATRKRLEEIIAEENRHIASLKAVQKKGTAEIPGVR